MKYSNIREEMLKNRVAQDFFGQFDCTEIIKNIDFAVKATPLISSEEGKNFPPSEGLGETYLLWAEAKQKSTDILEMLTQLVLTIGKARTFDEKLPPPFLGCFDNEKIAFVSYSEIQDIFYQNDFNWNIAPSNCETREFKQVYAQIKKIISPTLAPSEGGGDFPPLGGQRGVSIFYFEKDEIELKQFIRDNFVIGKSETTKTKIDKNNFITIYNKWLEAVKPTIQVDDWTIAKEDGVIDGYFYLADLLSVENKTLKEKLYVLLNTDHYVMQIGIGRYGNKLFGGVGFSDNQKAHTQFWAKYERPPLEEYWDYIIDRQDLLVPQDVRERKGSFYTPKIWVELSQKYLADVFGKDWQDEYDIWDCAAGTGNLLAGLTNKYKIWASTLDKADVDVMKQRIENGTNLLESHVFQFDFLNDDFSKLPHGLQDIINDPKRRQKLIIYINPPYAEAANYGKSKSGVSSTKIYNEFKNTISFAVNELFSQFFARIYKELPDCKLASFSTLKYVTASNFSKFRDFFKTEYLKGFVCRANTFDNVKGNFPIGFLIWNLQQKKQITEVKCDVFDKYGNIEGKKKFYSVQKGQVINDWLRKHYDKNNAIGYLRFVGPDFQANSSVYITGNPKESDIKESRIQTITQHNLVEMSIYFAVRKVISATWLNDRDQFLYPNNKWEKDIEFHNDCIAYTLFNNNIQSNCGVNHWLPFMEHEVNARDTFASHFMVSFLSGKIIQNGYSNLFEQQEEKILTKREFSTEAQAVFETGKKLWQYYHQQPKCNVNASLYDIREHFQGRSDKGNMNSTSVDETYNELIGNLRSELKTLAKKIETKVYEYGFLKL